MNQPAPREWTQAEVEAEAKRRRRLVNRGICPDSGYAIRRCKRTLCDCFDYEDEYGPSQR